METGNHRTHKTDLAKAEYLVMKCLEEHDGSMSYGDLKEEVQRVVNEMDNGQIVSPIQFTPGSGPPDIRSREFVRAISRCSDARDIIQNTDGFQLTPAGEHFLNNRESFAIPDEFASLVDGIYPDEHIRVAGD